MSKMIKKGALILFSAFFLAACTPSDSKVDTGKKYVGTSADECSRIRFVCEQDYQYFQDEKGCGCEPAEAPLPQGDADCLDDGKPVCAKHQVQCITTPCDPIWENFPNRCSAEKRNALEIREGACS